MDQAEAGSALRQKVGVFGVGVGVAVEDGVGREGGESGSVDAESSDAAVAAAVGGAVRDGACEME